MNKVPNTVIFFIPTEVNVNDRVLVVTLPNEVGAPDKGHNTKRRTRNPRGRRLNFYTTPTTTTVTLFLQTPKEE